MTGLRRLAAHRRWLAAWLVAACLAVRILVPAGYMPARPGGLALTICSGGMAAASTVAVPMPGMAGHGHDGNHGDHGSVDRQCPFAGAAMPSLAGGDQPVGTAPRAMPAAAPVGDLADARAPPRRAFLRPPLRGPPSNG